jgi:hypothetical protein
MVKQNETTKSRRMQSFIVEKESGPLPRRLQIIIDQRSRAKNPYDFPLASIFRRLFLDLIGSSEQDFSGY